jgi:predicted nuclease of restriction endonuclease-like (RecB) superfamily
MVMVRDGPSTIDNSLMRKLIRNPAKVTRRKPKAPAGPYRELLSGVVRLIEQARLAAVRSVNVVLTSTYWVVGQRIVEHEQAGAERAAYGEELIKRLAEDLTARLGRGFSERNLEQMRLFYLGWPIPQTVSAELTKGRIPQTVSAELTKARIPQTVSAKSGLRPLFPLPWSHYVRLLTVADANAREYYEREALQGGWSVRQLDRQIATLAYQRTRRARSVPAKDEILAADAHVRDPFVLEFLNLKDEYSETELEGALIRSLEQFLLELGSDFAFVARQKRLRVGTEWYRVDLVFFHRQLRCLIIVDLKLGKFTHADAGQMNLYLNYAREHWTHPHEKPPVGLILCSEKDAAVAHYALGNLANQVLAREYHLKLPREAELAARIDATRRVLAAAPAHPGPPRPK